LTQGVNVSFSRSFLVLVLSASLTMQPQGWAMEASSFNAEVDLIEQQANLACGGTHENPLRVTLAETLMGSSGMAPRLLKRLKERARQATENLDRAEEVLITRVRNARVEEAKANLEVAVQRLGQEKRSVKKELLRDQVRRLYGSYQESKKPAPLTESESELLASQRNKWMGDLKTAISLSDRVSAAVSKASVCLCKADDFLCKSADELNARKDQYKAYGDFLQEKAKTIQPASLGGASSLGK
jgi:hypothetical protein